MTLQPAHTVPREVSKDSEAFNFHPSSPADCLMFCSANTLQLRAVAVSTGCTGSSAVVPALSQASDKHRHVRDLALL